MRKLDLRQIWQTYCATLMKDLPKWRHFGATWPWKRGMAGLAMEGDCFPRLKIDPGWRLLDTGVVGSAGR